MNRVKGPGVEVVFSGPLDADGSAELFRTLSDPTRIRLLAALAGGECAVGLLVERLRLPQPVVSYQLSLLRDAGLVASTRHGKSIRYRLTGKAGV